MGRRFRHELGLIGTIAAVVVLVALLDAQHNYWADPYRSAVDVARHASLMGIFALGAALVIISGGIDLSTGSVIAFSGAVCAAVLNYLLPVGGSEPGTGQIVGAIAAALLATLLTGFLIGSLHAWLITVIGLPPFVATLATLVGLRSLARIIVKGLTGRPQIDLGAPWLGSFRYLGNSVWIGVCVCLALTLLLTVVMSRTVLGRHLYALGGNEQAARLSGIRTDRLKWFAYCASAMLASLAGALYVADQGVADPQTLGRGYELNGIAAAVVGGCSLQGGVGTIPGTLLGTIFLRIVVDGIAKVVKVGADLYEGLIVGVVVVLAVALTQARRRGWSRTPFFDGPLGLVSIVNLVLLSAALAAIVGPQFLPRALSPLTLAATVGGGVLILLTALRIGEQRAGRAPPDSV